MKSIQQRLLTSLLIGLPLLWVLTSSFIAWRLWHEINEMNDTQITQVARYLVGVTPKENKDKDKDNHQGDGDGKKSKNKHSAKIYKLDSKQLSGDLGEAEDDYMGFAIWDRKGRLLMADENGQSFDFLPDQRGFLEEQDSAYQRLNPFNKRWRLFYVHDNHDDKH
jgi:two-component system sensor histidine kinase QseC